MDRHALTALFALSTLMLLNVPRANALEPACAPLVSSSEAKIAAPAWHMVSKLDDFETEIIKSGGKFYMKTAGEWVVAPMNLDDAERKTIDALKNGSIKVSGCTDGGVEVINGVQTRVLVYTVEVPGSGIPPAQTRLNVGVSDNLPYSLSGAAGTTSQHVTYRYGDIKPPL